MGISKKSPTLHFYCLILELPHFHAQWQMKRIILLTEGTPTNLIITYKGRDQAHSSGHHTKGKFLDRRTPSLGVNLSLDFVNEVLLKHSQAIYLYFSVAILFCFSLGQKHSQQRLVVTPGSAFTTGRCIWSYSW